MNNANDDITNIYTNINALRRLQYSAKGFSFKASQPVNSALSGKNVSNLRGRGLNFEELRHYRPGDDIRSMDWKVTRRTGKPHVKVYTEERERNVFIAIDQRSNMFFGSTAKMKSVIAAELAALIAWQISDSGDRVGAAIYNNESANLIPAKRGRQHVVNLLSSLVKTNNELKVGTAHNNQSESFNNMLAKLLHNCGNNALIILVGDGNGWNDISTEYLKKFRQHNEVIACHISDPLEQSLPNMSQMVVSDGEQQIQFSSNKAQFQKRYKEELTEQLTTYVNTAKKLRVPMIEVSTTSSVEKQLRKALGQVAQ